MSGDAFVLSSPDPSKILQDVQQSVKELRDCLQRIKQDVTIGEASFKTVLQPLAHAENAFARDTLLLVFYANASPLPSVRSASEQARKIVEEAQLQNALDETLFHLIDAVVHKNEALSVEDARFLALKHRQSCQHGLAIPAGPNRDRLREIRRLISHYTALYRENLAKADDDLWFVPSDLDGIPEHVLSSLEVGTDENMGKLWLSLSIPHLTAALRYARLSEVRQQVLIAYESQCEENIDIFRNVVILRDEAARLLGYSSHASFKLADRMAKSPEVVESFHEDIRKTLLEPSVSEAAQLRELKAKDLGLSDGCDKEDYWLWDQPYYNRIMLERTYKIDHYAISEYFPLRTVIERMLLVFEHLFGLRFVPVTGGKEHAVAQLPDGTKIARWHDDVQVFATYDRDDKEAFLGLLYMDLYERDGKRPHPASCNLVPGFTDEDGTRQYPSTAFLCSFSKPTSDKPCLLRHEDLVLLFHELGHSVHDLVSKTTYACFHGTEVAVDFGEAPSQMLEHWCWEPKVLKFLSQHVSSVSNGAEDAVLDLLSNTKNDVDSAPGQIPDKMIASLIAARDVNAAHLYLNQLRLSAFDLAVHHPKSREALLTTNITALFNNIRRQIYPPRSPDDDHWAHGHVLFQHIMQEDYSAGYYSYMYSKVFAADMFETAFRIDPMNAEQGRRYRYAVLEPGGSRDGMEILECFLGRPPDAMGFRRCLSLEK